MFKNSIDLKMLGIWNLAITAVVLVVRLFSTPAEVMTTSLWAMPLFTLALGLLLVYRGTNRLDKGNAVLRVRMLLFVGSIAFLAVKYQPLTEEKASWLYLSSIIILLAALSWYFVRWAMRKTVAI